jgi:CRP-like cAMP-binding protein
MPVDPDRLRSVPLFQGMTDRAITAVAELADEAAFADGDVLVREGDPGDRLFIILDGSATVDQGGARIATLGLGAIIGEISLIDGRPRTATITCLGPVRAVVILRDGFERLMDGFPPVRLGVLMNLTERVRRDMDTATA